MTTDDWDKLLDVIEHELQSASFREAEAGCYGGGHREAAACYRALERIHNAVPLAFRADRKVRQRKAAADKLRRQADAIEAGSAT